MAVTPDLDLREAGAIRYHDVQTFPEAQIWTPPARVVPIFATHPVVDQNFRAKLHFKNGGTSIGTCQYSYSIATGDLGSKDCTSLDGQGRIQASTVDLEVLGASELFGLKVVATLERRAAECARTIPQNKFMTHVGRHASRYIASISGSATTAQAQSIGQAIATQYAVTLVASWAAEGHGAFSFNATSDAVATTVAGDSRLEFVETDYQLKYRGATRLPYIIPENAEPINQASLDRVDQPSRLSCARNTTNDTSAERPCLGLSNGQPNEARKYTGDGYYKAPTEYIQRSDAPRIFVVDTGIDETNRGFFQGQVERLDVDPPLTRCPDNWHGTGAALAAAGLLNGTAKGAKIIDAPIGCEPIYAGPAAAVLAEVFAVRRPGGGDVVVMSWGGPADGTDNELRRILDRAAGSMGLLAAADAKQVDPLDPQSRFENSVPCRFRSVLCVGGTDEDDFQRSRLGGHVRIFAPLFVTYMTDGSTGASFRTYNGTSMGTPYAAGAWLLTWLTQRVSTGTDPAFMTDVTKALLEGTAKAVRYGESTFAGLLQVPQYPRVRTERTVSTGLFSWTGTSRPSIAGQPQPAGSSLQVTAWQPVPFSSTTGVHVGYGSADESVLGYRSVLTTETFRRSTGPDCVVASMQGSYSMSDSRHYLFCTTPGGSTGFVTLEQLSSTGAVLATGTGLAPFNGKIVGAAAFGFGGTKYIAALFEHVDSTTTGARASIVVYDMNAVNAQWRADLPTVPVGFQPGVGRLRSAKSSLGFFDRAAEGQAGQVTFGIARTVDRSERPTTMSPPPGGGGAPTTVLKNSFKTTLTMVEINLTSVATPAVSTVDVGETLENVAACYWYSPEPGEPYVVCDSCVVPRAGCPCNASGTVWYLPPRVVAAPVRGPLALEAAGGAAGGVVVGPLFDWFVSSGETLGEYRANGTDLVCKAVGTSRFVTGFRTGTGSRRGTSLNDCVVADMVGSGRYSTSDERVAEVFASLLCDSNGASRSPDVARVVSLDVNAQPRSRPTPLGSRSDGVPEPASIVPALGLNPSPSGFAVYGLQSSPTGSRLFSLHP